MRRVIFSALTLGLILCSQGANSQSLVVQTCGTLPLAYHAGAVRNDTVDVNGNKCISGTITATATTSFTAQNTLPTLSPGAGAAGYESLGGAPYSQPVFGSASGGGTQVDATHGLPVNCIVGCAAGTGANNADSVAAVSTGLGSVQAYSFLWNGTTFDRWYGDKTNGAFVNVKTSVLPTGAASAANQATNTATTAHTCSTAGYSELGCLGQLDDDVKGAVPWLSSTAWNTNTYTTGTTNPGSADLHGAPWVDIGGINGVAALAGAGATGTGSPRVTEAQDTTTIAGSAPGTAGTPSANVVSVQGEASMTPVAVSGAVNVTPTDCSIALTSGGTAQNIITAAATVHGFTLANIDTSAGSGEPIWISFTTTAAASTAASYPLSAPTATTFAGLSSYTTPLGFGANHAVSVIAATTGHKISCTQW